MKMDELLVKIGREYGTDIAKALQQEFSNRTEIPLGIALDFVDRALQSFPISPARGKATNSRSGEGEFAFPIS